MSALTPRAVAAGLEVLRKGWLTMGPATEALERDLSEQLGGSTVIATSSGTAALHLSCLALGARAGADVLVPGIGPASCAGAPRAAGAGVMTYDLDGLDPDADLLFARRTPETAAAIVRHQAGFPARLDGVAERCRAAGISLIEDCRDAFGATRADGRMVGARGDVAVFSFSSVRQLRGGEGGAVVTNDEEVATKVRLLRSHAMTSGTWDRHRGHAETYDVVDVGFNYRIDEVRAAMVRAGFDACAVELEARRNVVKGLSERVREAGAELMGDDRLDRAAPLAALVLAGSETDVGPLSEELMGSPASRYLDSASQRPSNPHAEKILRRLVVVPIRL